MRRGCTAKNQKTHLPVSEAEDTAAILCVEPLASSSSAPLLRLLLASTVDSSSCLFRKRRILGGVRKGGSSNAPRLSPSLLPSFYCGVTHYLSYVPLPPFLSSHPLCHSTSSSVLSYTPPQTTMALFPTLLSSSVLVFQRSFLLSCLSVRTDGIDCAMQETGSQILPCSSSSSSSSKMSRHFLFLFSFEAKQRKLFLPLACITQQQQQQQCGTVCRLQSGGQIERWIDREGEREERGGGGELFSLFTAGCIPQLLHHAQTQPFL